MLFSNTCESLTTVLFRGTVIALACEQSTQAIHYRVLRAGADPGDEGGWWPAAALHFPDQVRAAGASVLTLATKDVYPKGNPMLGTAFSAAADDTHVYLFRTSTSTPATILVDRFLVVETAGEEVSYTLLHAWEVRYQRSGNRDLPESARDTFGYRSLDDTPFTEPTLDLVGLAPLPAELAGFRIVFLPGPKGVTSRWLLVTATTSGTLSWTVFDRNDDGLFLPGTAAPTSLTLTGMSDVSAPAALVYSQHEQVPSSLPPLPEGGDTLKRAVHLMLAVSGSGGAKQGIALLDLALDELGDPARVTLGSVSLAALAAAGPLPLLQRDGVLPVSGAFVTAADALGAVWPLESGDGLVHVYYRSRSTGDLSVLQFSPLVDRVVYEQPVEDGGLYFTARHAGIDAGAAPITISPSEGYAGALCDVTLTFPVGGDTLTESWALVPSDLGALVQVLTGGASHATEDDALIREGKSAFYNYFGQEGRLVYAYQPQADAPPPLWLVLRGRAADIVAADSALLVSVSGPPSDPVLTVACTVTYRVEDERTKSKRYVTYEESWLGLPLGGTPTCGDVAAILNGKPRGSSIRYHYGNARYFVDGVLDDSGVLADGSQLFTAVAPRPGAAFPAAVSRSALSPSPAVTPEKALPLSGPTTAMNVGMPGNGVWTGVLAGSFTVECWFQASTLASSAIVALTATDLSSTLILGLSGDSGSCVAAAFLATGGTSAVPATIGAEVRGPAVGDGGWHHLALTCADGEARVFLDGVPGAPEKLSPAFGTSPGVGYLTFGLTNYVQYDGQTQLTLPFGGSMAEVRLWSRALTDEELRAGSLLALDPAREEGLVARWPINDGGSTVQGYPAAIGTVAIRNPAWTQPSGVSPVPQGVSSSGLAAPPPAVPFSRLFVPSTRGVSLDQATLAGLLGSALTPGKVWPAPGGPAAGVPRVPGVVAEAAIDSLGFFGNGAPGEQSVVTFPETTFDFEGDLSFESWIRPNPFATGKEWTQRIVESRSGAPAKTDFAVALRNLWSVALDGKSSWLELGSLPIPDSVSILMRLSLDGPSLGEGAKVSLIGKYDATFGSILRVRLVGGDRISVVFGPHADGDRHVAAFPLEEAPQGPFVLALTLQPDLLAGSGKMETTVSCYVNGKAVGVATVPTTTADCYEAGRGDGDWVIGMDWDAGGRKKSEWLAGTIDELQIWSGVIGKERLGMEETLSGAEPGLVTYLTFNEGPDSPMSFDRSAGQNHARLLTDGTGEESPPKWTYSIAKKGGFASVVFGGGGRGSAASTGYPVAEKRWTHLAVTYESNYLVEFGGTTRLVCGAREELDFDRALTIEAWVSGLGGERPVGTLLGKWGATGTDRSYLLEIDTEGHVVFSVSTGQQVAVTGSRDGAPHGPDPSNPDDSTVVLTSKSALPAGDGWSYVVATFASDVSGEQGSRDGAPYDPQGVRSSVTMALFVDGRLDASTTLPPREMDRDHELAGRIEIRRTPTETMIGDTAGRAAAALARARVAEIRAWNRPLDAATIAWVWRNRRVPNAREGLVAYWEMDEGEGLVVHDRAGGNDATSAEELRWDHSSLAAVWRLYIDGVEEPWIAPLPGFDASAPTVPIAADAPPMTLGACATGPISVETVNAADWLGGYLSDVRAWRCARTPAEIAQWTHTRVAAGAQDLAGYWPMTPVAGPALADVSPNGNDGTIYFAAMTRSPTAPPLRNERDFVVNALYLPAGVSPGGRPEAITGTPAVFEYGSLVQLADGRIVGGAMKRAYAFPASQGSRASGPLVVGSLRATFIGQVQFAPTLVGYIEGAPPVPSENLTRPFWINPAASTYLFYDGTSRLALASRSSDRFTVSASRDDTSKTSVAAKLSLAATAKVELPSSVYGVVKFKATTAMEAELGLQTKFEHTLGWLSGARRGVQTGWARREDMILYGAWEPPLLQDGGPNRRGYPRLGRRYLPDNVGSALVRSGTADVYALALEQTGALVTYQMAPDPDIPEDWNVIMFPIRKSYVENGVLDGFVGFWPVSDPPTTSYFQVVEAYRLKRRIEKETRELEMYYELFDAGAEGRSGDALADGGDATLGAARPQRSLVNTYVWTAGGGLHREQMQALSLWEDSSGGSYDFMGQAGIFGSRKVSQSFRVESPTLNAEAGVELRSSFETMFGGQLKTVVTKDRSGENALELNVDVTGDSWLRGWTGKDYTSFSVPGKVDGYRFMSYFLSPSTDHGAAFFDEVVDRDWLDRSPDPSARALRAAMGGGDAAWRVLHRVTYVSRVPPRTESDLDRGLPMEDASDLEPAVINEQNNVTLIALVRAQLGTTPPTWGTVGAAVDKVQDRLAWMSTAANWQQIRPLLVRYLGSYFGLAPQ